jgi:hypothetical protein
MSIAMLVTLPYFAYAAGSPAEPQNPNAAKNTLRDPDLDALDAFLDSTPEVSKDVHQNPALLNDQKYVSEHPGLAKLLQEHPRLREQARQNPAAVLRQEQRWDNRGGDISKWQVQALDKFLDEHPQIDQDLRKNPRLASDDAYVDKHPQFKAFLKEHPGVRESINEHPQMLMNRERRYEKSEDKKADPR